MGKMKFIGKRRRTHIRMKITIVVAGTIREKMTNGPVAAVSSGWSDSVEGIPYDECAAERGWRNWQLDQERQKKRR